MRNYAISFESNKEVIYFFSILISPIYLFISLTHWQTNMLNSLQ